MCVNVFSPALYTQRAWEQWYAHVNEHNYLLDFGFEIEFSTKKNQRSLK